MFDKKNNLFDKKKAALLRTASFHFSFFYTFFNTNICDTRRVHEPVNLVV